MLVKKQPLSTFIIDDFYHFHSCEIQGKNRPFATQLSYLFLFLCWCMTNAPSCSSTICRCTAIVRTLSIWLQCYHKFYLSTFWFLIVFLKASLNNPQFVSVILITTKWPALQMQSLSREREREKESIHTLPIVCTSSRLIS
jgi:hypothetical protein